MKTYIAEIIPRIQRFSQKIDDLTKLMNQRWVSIGDIDRLKRVYIFRPNNELLISVNGDVEKGKWEYLGKQSLLIDTKQRCELWNQGFFDQNIIALQKNGTNNYAFFVNETKYDRELNTIQDILSFLDRTYLQPNNIGSKGIFSRIDRRSNKKIISKIISQEQKEWMGNPDKCPACGHSGVMYKLQCPDCDLNLR